MLKINEFNELLETVKKETIPALGCTEPVAVAYAVSVANKYLDSEIQELNIKTSKNIFKNGKSVLIPNTGERGLDLAGGLGIVCGDPKLGLMVLEDVNKDSIRLVHQMINEGKVNISYVEDAPDVYVEVLAKGTNKEVNVVLKDCHDHIDTIEVSGKVVYKNTLDKANDTNNILESLSIEEIIKFVETVDIEKLDFIEQGIKMNKLAAEIGIIEGKGMGIGARLKEIFEENKINISGPIKARIWTAAAADLRMGGGTCPIMTSGGSGNQGLGVILPIVAVAEEQNIEKEKLIRAVFLGHIINKYVKLFSGKLSYMCGCGIAAGVGASAGISWMLEGSMEQISGACNNMLANLTGMICDGAKETCALKLSTSAEEAVISAYLANENIMPESNIGVVGNTLEETIENVGKLCKAGDSSIETAIIEIIN